MHTLKQVDLVGVGCCIPLLTCANAGPDTYVHCGCGSFFYLLLHMWWYTSLAASCGPGGVFILATVVDIALALKQLALCGSGGGICSRIYV